VLFREPLKPPRPAEDHATTFPFTSVIETMVLLKVALIKTIPTGTTFPDLLRRRPATVFAAGNGSGSSPGGNPLGALSAAAASAGAASSAFGAAASGFTGASGSIFGSGVSLSGGCSGVFSSAIIRFLNFLYALPVRLNARGLSCGLIPDRADRFLRSLPRPCIGRRALTPYWKAAPMTHPAVAADTDQPANVLLHVTPKIPFNQKIGGLKNLRQPPDFIVRQIVCILRAIKTCLGDYFQRESRANAKDVAEGVLQPLSTRYVYSQNSWHDSTCFRLVIPVAACGAG
jgi:hypothetical protein